MSAIILYRLSVVSQRFSEENELLRGLIAGSESVEGGVSI